MLQLHHPLDFWNAARCTILLELKKFGWDKLWLYRSYWFSYLYVILLTFSLNVTFKRDLRQLPHDNQKFDTTRLNQMRHQYRWEVDVGVVSRKNGEKVLHLKTIRYFIPFAQDRPSDYLVKKCCVVYNWQIMRYM